MSIIAFPICPACGNQQTTKLRDYRASCQVFGDLSLLSCQVCTFVFAYPTPSQSELDIYNKRYFTNAHSGLPTSDEAIAFHKALALLRKEYISSYITSANKSVSSVLEVGPGQGFLAQCWLRDHPAHQYTVLETDNDCCRILESQGILCDNRPRKRSVDLVIASHVVEHVPNPTAFLGLITTFLKPGGSIFIEVPCQDFLHKPLDEPHLLFFNDKSMETLLKRIGFVDIHTSYYGRPISSLEKRFSFTYTINTLRSRLAKAGPLGSFLAQIKCNSLCDSMQKAVMLPYQPHIPSAKPAWWLRAMATFPG